LISHDLVHADALGGQKNNLGSPSVLLQRHRRTARRQALGESVAIEVDAC
jgi:hypothetical protein